VGSRPLEMTTNTLPFNLIVTDIDNTVFDWVRYYVTSFNALLDTVADRVGSTRGVLAAEAREVFQRHGSIEYPFLAQELDSVNRFYGLDIDRMLSDAVYLGREAFMQASRDVLRPYDDVHDTLRAIKNHFPDLPIVALTDAPRYVAMWKLNKLGILSFFDAVYGLADPRVPTCEINRRVKVDPEILLKHLQQSNFGFKGKIRILPDEYEKPGVRGLKTVLMDFEMDEPAEVRSRVLWVGDNLRKDVGLGNRLGVMTAWAKYGTNIEASALESLGLFSPPQNIQKNVFLRSDDPNAPKPSLVLERFSDLLNVLGIGNSKNKAAKKYDLRRL
jgi:FMN phosphatase YigB (HAD superfamily)